MYTEWTTSDYRYMVRLSHFSRACSKRQLTLDVSRNGLFVFYPLMSAITEVATKSNLRYVTAEADALLSRSSRMA